MSQPRVLFIVHKACPSIGGIESFISELAPRLIQAEAEVVVAAIEMSRDTPVPAGMAYKVVYGPGWMQAWRLLKWAQIVHFDIFDYGWWFLAKLLRKRIVFVYHSHSRVCPKVVAWNGKEPCTFATHWRQCPGCLHKDYGWPEVWVKWLSLPIKQRIVNGADMVVNISKYTEKLFQIPRSRTILMGINLERFQAVASPTRDYILFAGRLIPEKGCQVLLKAFARCIADGRQMRLVILGDGPYRSALETLARSLGIESRVEFQGAMTGPKLVERIQNALAVVVPSIGPEGWARTPLEAMACGTPVIAAASGGLTDIGEAGLQYPRLDAEALAGHLMRLMDDSSLRQHLQQAGRDLAPRHDAEVMTLQYLSLYRELLMAGS